ncbi:MAG: pyridoxamine 5'-phosphate oxidase family protein [Chitinivibrionales bacterium]|nr:pyridoxamine 5'-phosphate oxidase family protein [Chitinivibrionales bacterium]
MVDKQEVFSVIKEVLQLQKFAVLSTHGGEYPYSSLVGIADTSDCREILFATLRQTQKFCNIKRWPNVSLLVDTRTNQGSDFAEAVALTAFGKATEVWSDNQSLFMAVLLRKHPQLADFVDSGDCALVKIVVTRYILVNSFQNISEYIPL